MTEFMADIKAHAGGVAVRRIHDVGIQDDVATTQKPSRKRVEDAVAIQNEQSRHFLHVERFAALDQLLVHARQLDGGHLNALAAQMRHKGEMRNQITDEQDGNDQ